MKSIIVYLFFLLVFGSCAAQRPASGRSPVASFLADTVFRNAHVGISVYEPATGKYVYEYQSEKYFVPASNVKIITTYAVMKHLKHILPGLRYYENDTAVYLVPTGDPSFLHRDFMEQPVFRFLKEQPKKIFITDKNWKDHELGQGWSWDDFSDEYMTERNAFPVYGNTIRWVQEKLLNNSMGIEQSFSTYSDPEVNWKVRFEVDSTKKKFRVRRDRMSNVFYITEGTENRKEVFVPFITNGVQTTLELLEDTLGKTIAVANNFLVSDPQRRTVWSQPTDSILRPMMYRSDNFFAEQLLLMVSEEKLGIMDAELIIDTLLNNDLRELPQAPVWVDGSGLSRYNLFTPRDFVWVLNRMRAEFGMDRIREIFPTGDSGTLKGYYSADNGRIYAKTGSMSGVVAVSGYLYTRTNRLLVFSVLVNNYKGTGAAARRSIERFVKRLR